MSIINSYIGESSVDLSIRGLGHIEGLVKFCIDNGLSLDHEESAVVGDRLIDDSLKSELLNNRPLFAKKVQAKQENVVIHPKQNIVDLALQETGSIEGLVGLLKGNSYDPNADPSPGAQLIVSALSIVDSSIRSFYKALQYVVNTGGQDSIYVLLENGLFTLKENSELIELE